MYHNGKRFLQSQELAILRAMSTNQVEAFDGSNRFAGDSVFDLIRHLCLRGLQYSKPEAGDEPTYKLQGLGYQGEMAHFAESLRNKRR